MKRMNILTVIEILFNGGYIVERIPPVQGRVKCCVYGGAVYEQSADKQAYVGHTCYGYITSVQLEKMLDKGIIECVDDWSRTDKYGNKYHRYVIKNNK